MSDPLAEKDHLPTIDTEPMVKAMFADPAAVVTEAQMRAVSEAWCTPLAKVAAIHAPFECSNVRCPGGGLHCRTCEDGLAAEAENGGSAHWPCPTLRALGISLPPGQHPAHPGGDQ